MVTSIVSFQQGNIKKSKNSIKLINIEEKNLHLLNHLKIFNETFQKNAANDNIKSRKKAGFLSHA